MWKKRASTDRGQFDLGWLKSQHTFSFGHYMDPRWMGFSQLRVINEDHIMPGMGFNTHSHRDMEIITFVLSGVVEHKDSLGNLTQIKSGEIQIMTAGTGVEHSEFNPSLEMETHLLQIWINPHEKNCKPGYRQFFFEEKINETNLLSEGQNYKLFLGYFNNHSQISLSPNKQFWLHVFEGSGMLSGNAVSAGDSLYLSNEDQPKMTTLDIAPNNSIKFLFFELP